MNSLTKAQFTAFIGIDWAEAKHDVCLQAANAKQHEIDCFPHQVDRIAQWAYSMHQRFGGPIAVALKLAKGPIVSALQKHDFVVLFPINPSTLAKYREAFKPSRANTLKQYYPQVDAVIRERCSARKFPANREKYRENSHF